MSNEKIRPINVSTVATEDDMSAGNAFTLDTPDKMKKLDASLVAKASDIALLRDEIANASSKFSLTLNGNNLEWVTENLSSRVPKGKSVKVTLDKTTWQVATNPNAYSLGVFKLSYKAESSQEPVIVANVAMAAHATEMTSHPNSSYTIDVPSDLEYLNVSIRAASGENITANVDSDYQIKERVDGLENDVATLSGHVSSLGGAVAGLTRDVGTLNGSVSALNGEVDELSDRIDNIGAPVEVAIEGLGINAVTTDLTDKVVPGKTVKISLDKTTWQVPTNPNAGPLTVFNLNYKAESAEQVNVANVTIPGRASEMTTPAQESYTIDVPSDLEYLKIYSRVAIGETLTVTVDTSSNAIVEELASEVSALSGTVTSLGGTVSTLSGEVTNLNGEVDGLNDKVDSIGFTAPVTFQGNDMTLVTKDLTDKVVPGKTVKISLDKTTWQVAENPNNSSRAVFNLYYKAVGGSNVSVAAINMAAHATEMTSHPNSNYTIDVPSDLEYLKIDFRGAVGETLTVTLDTNEMNARIDELEASIPSVSFISTVMSLQKFVCTGTGESVTVDMTNLAAKGKKYVFKCDQTKWAFTNTSSSSKTVFKLWYNDGTASTTIYQRWVYPNSSRWTGNSLQEKIEVQIPENCAVFAFSFMADAGESLTFRLDPYYDDAADVNGMYPAAEYLPKVGMLKTMVPNSGQTNTPVCLLWFSDVHGDVTAVERIVAFRKKYTEFIDDVLNTGDSVLSNLGDYAAYESMLSKGADKFLVAVGNHDAAPASGGRASWTESITIAEMYSKFVGAMNVDGVVRQSGKNYYYKDYTTGMNSAPGVRLIVLDGIIQPSAYATSQETADYADGQYAWFVSTLAAAKTAGLAVICAVHGVTTIKTMPSESGFAGMQNWTSSCLTERYFTAVDDYINGGGEFVAWLCGHEHLDTFGLISGHPLQLGIAIITATSTGNPSRYAPYRTGKNGEVPVTEATDAFNLIAFDTYRKEIRMVRVGATYDSYGHPLDTICISWQTLKEVDKFATKPFENIPTFTAADAGKILKINLNGELEWAAV